MHRKLHLSRKCLSNHPSTVLYMYMYLYLYMHLYYYLHVSLYVYNHRKLYLYMYRNRSSGSETQEPMTTMCREVGSTIVTVDSTCS